MDCGKMLMHLYRWVINQKVRDIYTFPFLYNKGSKLILVDLFFLELCLVKRLYSYLRRGDFSTDEFK